MYKICFPEVSHFWHCFVVVSRRLQFFRFEMFQIFGLRDVYANPILTTSRKSCFSVLHILIFLESRNSVFYHSTKSSYLTIFRFTSLGSFLSEYMNKIHTIPIILLLLVFSINLRNLQNNRRKHYILMHTFCNFTWTFTTNLLLFLVISQLK